MPAPSPDRIRQVDDQLRETIRKAGWSNQLVGAGEVDPNFGYTIGFIATLDHPEVFIVGLPFEMTHHILNQVGQAIQAGYRFSEPCLSDQFLEGYDVAFRPVTTASADAHSGTWSRIYGDGIRAVQMVLPDREGLFPWDENCREGTMAIQTALLETTGDIPTARAEQTSLRPTTH